MRKSKAEKGGKTNRKRCESPVFSSLMVDLCKTSAVNPSGGNKYLQTNPVLCLVVAVRLHPPNGALSRLKVAFGSVNATFSPLKAIFADSVDGVFGGCSH